MVESFVVMKNISEFNLKWVILHRGMGYHAYKGSVFMKRELIVTAMLFQGCTEKIDCSLDSDSDGLNDCEEQELGTNPDSSDSDGDGFSDADEVDCVSNPADASEQCYACGWEHNDPGDLVSTGNDYGDVVANLQLPDQCEEVVDLWDFHGEYHILFMTAAW